MTNFKAFSVRIKQAEGNIEQINKLDWRVSNHYHMGTLTQKEFMKLDDMIFALQVKHKLQS